MQELFEASDSNVIERPYFIAEAGVNHEGSIELARQLIEEAAEGGADAIKFQSYKAHTLASKHSPAYWDLEQEPTTSQYQLFKKYDAFWKDEYEKLKIHCDRIGIEFMSTPFDAESATFLNDLVKVYKIASADITNFPLIEQVCRHGKPVLLSTGASNIEEIQEAVTRISEFHIPLGLMHCVLNYPTQYKNANLGMIVDLKHRFAQHLIGYSDHTSPADSEPLIVATLLGAKVIEKHFTHDKTLPGNDHYHAMDKEDLKQFNKRVDAVMELIGESSKRVLESEELSRENARRSIVARRKISEGSTISLDLIDYKRPGTGISPKYYQKVVGMVTRCDIDEDDILQWWMLEDGPG